MSFRVGAGHDSHTLAAGGPLRVGGVDIPHTHHAVGHSDADVLLHALTDAILGALAEGDIGTLFPNTAAENAGRDSADFVAEALRRANARGYRLVNIDSTVFAQRPKLSPHRETIRSRIAELLGVNVDQVSLKAKTGEGVGPIGREEALAAEVIVLLEKTT